MFHRHASFRRRPLLVIILALFIWVEQPQAKGQDTSPGIDFFSGVNLSFADMNFYRQYDVLIHLTPGFKWNMGHHWQLAGQAVIPIVNTFGDSYKYTQIGAFNVSKEFRVSKLYIKTTVGVFDMYRYGADMKVFLPFSEVVAAEGQVGYVGLLYFDPSPHIYKPNCFVWTVGGDIYLPRWNTQFRGTVGRYLHQDFGCEGEAMRHFNHTTVSLYGRWSGEFGLDGGFRVVIMLPPYHRKHRTVNFRPASNYRMSYAVMYKIYSNSMYHTDPEQNERDGWFSRDLLHWGSHTMEPDFIITNKSDQP
jgi:hypothetical protein